MPEAIDPRPLKPAAPAAGSAASAKPFAPGARGGPEPRPGQRQVKLRAQGLNFHVALAGPDDGPLVMLLHGFPETSYAWRHQSEALATAGFRVAMPDLRGYGLSDKPDGRNAYRLDTLAQDVVQLVAALGHTRFSLVGHDWGGVLAWHLAMHQHPFIERVVVLNAPHPATLLRYSLRNPLQLLRSAYVGLFQLPLLPEWALKTSNYRALALAMTATARPGTFSDAELAVYREAWRQEGALTSMLNWYRALALPGQPPGKRITLPLRIIWGDRDTALAPGLAEEGLDWCDHGEVIHLPRATHWLHHEESARVNELLLEFLTRKPASVSSHRPS